MDKITINQLQGRPKRHGAALAIKAGDFVFTSGRWGGSDVQGRSVDGIEAQTMQSLENMKEVLQAVGASMTDAIKITILLKNPTDLNKMENIYRKYFHENTPVCTIHNTSGVHPQIGAGLIETDCIAYSSLNTGIFINKKIINQLPGRAKTTWAHSPVIKAGDFVFTTGRWGGVDDQGKPVEGIEAQTRQCLENVKELLQAADTSLSDVVKVTLLLSNPDDYDNMEKVYRSYFPKDQPCRTIHILRGFHPEGLIEIDCIAYCPISKDRFTTKKVISQLPGRAKTAWAHSPVIKAGDFVFTTGRWGGVDDQGKPVEGIEAQTRQCLENVKELLQAAGASLSDVVKTTVLLKTQDDFDKMNSIFLDYFSTDPPVRITHVIRGFHPEGLIGIDCIAYCPK